eukprot:6154791-Amphidinium_carterae.1
MDQESNVVWQRYRRCLHSTSLGGSHSKGHHTPDRLGLRPIAMKFIILTSWEGRNPMNQDNVGPEIRPNKRTTLHLWREKGSTNAPSNKTDGDGKSTGS